MDRKIKRPTRERKFSRKDTDEASGPFRRVLRAPRLLIPRGTDINYKNVAFLQKCLTERGKIFSRRLTNANTHQQRQISQAVKLARFLGLLSVGSSKRR